MTSTTTTATTPLPNLTSTTTTTSYRPPPQASQHQHQQQVLPLQPVHQQTHSQIPHSSHLSSQHQQHRQHHPHRPNQTSHPNPPVSNAANPKPLANPPRSQPSQSDPVLPRGSRVRITGNNRTKWDLIDRVGHVRAAQTLGGWHEVQLTDGGVVRVQRNALAVLELPPVDQSSLVRIESARRDNPVPVSSTVKKRVKKPTRSGHANISKLNFSSLKRYRTVYNLNVSSDCSRDELVGAVRKHFERTKVNESEVISNFLRHIARRSGPPASD